MGSRDAVSLAWRLAEIVRGLDDEALLDGYEREDAGRVRGESSRLISLGWLSVACRPLRMALITTLHYL
jgi:hypothetical protein